MKYIGNILTDEHFEAGELFNVVQDPGSLVDGIPTLIVGWENTKKLYPDASIIEFNITGDTYWTYGKYEKRDRFEVNVKRFQDLAFKKFVESLKYEFYDVIFHGPETFERFINAMSSAIPMTVYASNDILYIYIEGNSFVLGISLRDCDYIDETYRKRIFATIYGNKSINLLKNNDDISKEVRFKARGMVYILPYLYS